MTELEFGARLKQLRQQKRLTQQELADQLGVSNKSVSRWESGGYPDVATLAPLAKALGVSMDELLGGQPPLRNFGRSDWQNLMSYAFALGGGVVFYLLDLFMPTVLCFLLYLAMMAYGIHLQRHYTYHSHWFYGANALMDFFVNLRLLSFLPGGQLLVSGGLTVSTVLGYFSGAGEVAEWVWYLARLAEYLLPWLLLALLLTGVTQLVIRRTAGEPLRLPPLTLSGKAVRLSKLPPVLAPVLLAGFWGLYSTEEPTMLWLYEQQTLLYLLLWLVLTAAVLGELAVVRQRWMLLPAGLMQLGCLLYPALAGKSRAFSTVSGRFIAYSVHLDKDIYIPFGQLSGGVLAGAAVLAALYLLSCALCRKPEYSEQT